MHGPQMIERQANLATWLYGYQIEIISKTVIDIVENPTANMTFSTTARDFNPGIPNPGIPAHFLNPESRDWRCINPGISGL